MIFRPSITFAHDMYYGMINASPDATGLPLGVGETSGPCQSFDDAIADVGKKLRSTVSKGDTIVVGERRFDSTQIDEAIAALRLIPRLTMTYRDTPSLRGHSLANRLQKLQPVTTRVTTFSASITLDFFPVTKLQFGGSYFENQEVV